jgi:hypothetical protein
MSAKDRMKKMGAVEDPNCCVHGVRHGRGFMGLKLRETPMPLSDALPPRSAVWGSWGLGFMGFMGVTPTAKHNIHRTWTLRA